MTDRPNNPAAALAELFHHRWAVPTIAALQTRGGGAKFVTLQRAMDISRDSLARTLAALGESRRVVKNPGYGHPMRPEYILGPAGKQIAAACVDLVEKLERLDLTDVALNKWSLPVVYALAESGGRFNQLRTALPGITPRALTQALRDLENAGLVSRYLVDGNPPRTEYALTRRGQTLVPLLEALSGSL